MAAAEEERRTEEIVRRQGYDQETLTIESTEMTRRQTEVALIRLRSQRH